MLKLESGNCEDFMTESERNKFYILNYRVMMDEFDGSYYRWIDDDSVIIY